MLWVFLMGMLGGVANSLLLEDGFVYPRKVVRSKDRTLIDPGVFGNLLLGGITALTTNLLGASHLELSNQLGIALVSGVGGGNILTSLLQKYETGILKAQMEALEKTVKRFGGGPDDA